MKDSILHKAILKDFDMLLGLKKFFNLTKLLWDSKKIVLYNVKNIKEI